MQCHQIIFKFKILPFEARKVTLIALNDSFLLFSSLMTMWVVVSWVEKPTKYMQNFSKFVRSGSTNTSAGNVANTFGFLLSNDDDDDTFAININIVVNTKMYFSIFFLLFLTSLFINFLILFKFFLLKKFYFYTRLNISHLNKYEKIIKYIFGTLYSFLSFFFWLNFDLKKKSLKDI